MAEYNSETKVIPYSDMDVFAVLSDLNNLELIKDKIPQDKIKDFSFNCDSCTITVDPVGKIKFNVIERKPNELIKFQAEQLPFGLILNVHLKRVDDSQTEMEINLSADLNPFLKPMLSKPLQQGLDKISDTLAILPYNEILNNKRSE